jgi:hypothetical protein
VGNGLVDDALAVTTLATWSYARGLIDETDWAAKKKCCKGDVDGCDFNALSNDCQETLLSKDIPLAAGFNVYDIYRNCTTNPKALFVPVKSMRRSGTVSLSACMLSIIIQWEH